MLTLRGATQPEGRRCVSSEAQPQLSPLMS